VPLAFPWGELNRPSEGQVAVVFVAAGLWAQVLLGMCQELGPVLSWGTCDTQKCLSSA
jgi:hypothetical protein